MCKACKLYVEIDYDDQHTDPESLATAMDRLMETVLSTPGILDDYGSPEVGEFFVDDPPESLACARCGSPLDSEGFCTDETCPFSDHSQTCPVGWTGHPNCPFGRRDAMPGDCTCGRVAKEPT